SEWKLREYEDKCRVSRSFGEGDESVTLWLEQGGKGQIFNLTLLGEPLKNPFGPAIRVRLGDEEELVRSYIAATSSKGRPVLRMYGLTPVQPEMEKDKNAETPDTRISRDRLNAIGTLAIRGGGLRDDFRLMLGDMSLQFDFLQECGEKVGAVLTEAGRPLTREASPPIALNEDKWLNSADFPAYLQKSRMEGKVDVRLTVSKTGKPSACTVVQSNKPQLFDDAVCLGLLKRAKFKPAQNGDGEPVPSYYFQRVTFALRR
ncbi:MAG: energy transducer TonB, partial [Pseudomonadota bacterium]